MLGHVVRLQRMFVQSFSRLALEAQINNQSSHLYLNLYNYTT